MVIHSGANALFDEAKAARNKATAAPKADAKISLKRKISKNRKSSRNTQVMKVIALNLFTSDSTDSGKKATIPLHRQMAGFLAKIASEGMREIKPKRLPKGSGKRSGASQRRGPYVCNTAGTLRPLR